MKNPYIPFLSMGGIFLMAVYMVSCQHLMPDEPAPETVLAGMVEGLTDAQRLGHIRGDGEFGRVFAAADGLGPVFVATSCEGCHIGDGKGHPSVSIVRFGRYHNGTFDPLVALGGPQLQHRAIPGYVGETVPAEATGRTRLIAPAVTGLGFLAAVPDQAILAIADPNDSNGDGVSGVASWVAPPSYFIPGVQHSPVNGLYVGRFGRKAGAIDLFQQTVQAYVNDIGITSDFHPQDIFNPAQGEFTGDGVADPEVPAATVHSVVLYLRSLQAPPRRDAGNADVQAGERLFTEIGCAACHRPTLRTGPSDIEALSHRDFHPYTDLLLHDMGPGLDDGYTEGSAHSAEWRTTPLWGLGLSADSQGGQAFYLHDGRATSLENAIELHSGEAANSQAQYLALTDAERQQLIKFLESL